ncbi:MAG: peptide deformylase [Pirellulaceae bacterium]|nr:peptide deformylase [Pirellulaceae bacterium]
MNIVSELSIIKFPHPTLRYQAKSIRRVDEQLREIIARMFELMYEQRGVGLAATQVDLPLRLFVMNASGNPGEGQEVVMINPVLSRPRGVVEADEGCLSLPNVNARVNRAKTIRVNAYMLDGTEVDRDFSGFEARIIQHEADHLNGKLFIDRLTEGAHVDFADELEALQSEFAAQQRAGSIPDHAALQAQLQYWEQLYC